MSRPNILPKSLFFEYTPTLVYRCHHCPTPDVDMEIISHDAIRLSCLEISRMPKFQCRKDEIDNICIYVRWHEPSHEGRLYDRLRENDFDNLEHLHI